MNRTLRRAGVSLLEVLFSIGVVAIGLLGVISVLPVALGQVGRGNVSDRVLRLGQNAEEEFFSRDMFRASLWGQPAARLPPNTASTHYAKAPILTDPTADLAFCIDPQFVAANVLTDEIPSGATVGNRTMDPDMFPYAQDPVALASASTEYPQIQRLSLLNSWAPSTAVTPQAEILRPAHADALFILDDELSFDIPPEKTDPPTQLFGTSGGRRQFEGTASWFATIAPVANISATSDSFYLSIVVVNRRDRRFPVDNFDENLVRIPDANFHISGYRGGDVTLVANKLEELDVRIGQWIMLMRTWIRPTGLKKTPIVRWYRVTSVDPSPENVGSLWQLDVTLDGPDWPVSSSQPETRAVIMRGVTEVFERTIRAEI